MNAREKLMNYGAYAKALEIIGILTASIKSLRSQLAATK